MDTTTYGLDIAKRVFQVALANKMARTAWALLAHDKTYQQDYAAVRQAA